MEKHGGGQEGEETERYVVLVRRKCHQCKKFFATARPRAGVTRWYCKTCAATIHDLQASLLKEFMSRGGD